MPAQHLRLVRNNDNNPEFRRSANVASSSSQSTHEVPTFAELMLATQKVFDRYAPEAQTMPTSAIVTVGAEVVPEPQSPSEQSQVNIDGDEMAGPTREELDAKLETAAAQTDIKFARLEGKMDLMISKQDDAREDRRHLRNNIYA